MAFRGGLHELMRRASQLQRKMERRRQELSEQQFEGEALGGRVKVVVSGEPRVRSVHVEPELLQQEELSVVLDLLAAATNAALQKAQQHVEREMQKLTGGVRMPGLF